MSSSQQNDSIAIKAKKLSDLFNTIEGRRPRILTAGVDVEGQEGLHEISSLLADLGCDVDMSPKSQNLTVLAKQYLENDADILFLCAGTYPDREELHRLEKSIRLQCPEAVLALYISRDEGSALSEQLENWVVISPQLEKNNAGYRILLELLNLYQNE